MNEQEESLKKLLDIDLDVVMEDIMDIAQILDNTYSQKPSNYYMKYLQLSKLDTKSMLLSDLINWLSVLAISDGDFSIIEIDFIKRYLRLNMSNYEIVKFVHDCVESGFLEVLPPSIALFMEDDKEANKIKDELGDTRRQDFATRLFFAFKVIGLQFIFCDGKVHDNEIALLLSYTKDLEKKMENLNIEEFSEYYHKQIKEEIGI